MRPASSLDSDQDPARVYLDDLTSAIDLALLLAFGTAIYLLRRRQITLVALTHALSVLFLVLVAGHYVETCLLGLENLQNLARRRRTTQLGEWLFSGALSLLAVGAIGEDATSYRGRTLPRVVL